MNRISTVKELRSFLLLWSSQTVSELGTAMTEYALIIWVYGKQGTASSITILTLCSFMPTILFRFLGGALADRWNKKRIMLFADLFAAGGSAVILALFSFSALEIWHLYVINVILSLMNAVQAPASFVAAGLLVPAKHYARISGLQSLSRSIVSILAPALGSILLTAGGLKTVLICDLGSFGVAFLTLLFLIRIPETAKAQEEEKEPFRKTLAEGIGYLRTHTALFRISLFLAAVNFFAKLGNDGMLSPFVLGRTGNDQTALGMVQSAVAAGLLAGSVAVTFLKPAKKKTRVVFLTCAVVFAGNVALSLTFSPYVWCAVSCVCYAVAVVMNANLTVILREKVPSELQGRVFSVKDTLSNGTIPLGLYLGGVLADHVFEPLMASDTPLGRALAPLFGTGSGSGIAVMFFLVGIAGILLSLTRLAKKIYRTLDEE